MKRLLILTISFFIIGFASGADETNFIAIDDDYGGNAKIYSVNPSTGTDTLLKTMPIGARFTWFDPYENIVYLREDHSSAVWSYNIGDGTTTNLGTTANNSIGEAFTYNSISIKEKISTNTTSINNNTTLINQNTQDIHGSVALSSAMSALPNSSDDATSTCGMGTGFHKGLSAISAGCAMDFSTLTQNENLSPLFKRASVNLGTSAIMNSTGFSNFALRAGLTFKLGAKKSSGTDLSMNEDLQRYSTGTNTRIAELKKENDTLRAEMDALKSNQKNEMDALNAKLDALIASLNNG
jgi:hypothetical protein